MLNNFTFDWFDTKHVEAMIFSTLLIGAYYPLTQIYQHEEDGERGDNTISLKLGIRGTFIFSAALFLISFAFAYFYFDTNYSTIHFVVLMLSLLPAIGYFFKWFLNTIHDKKNADFDHSMRMTFISSTCLLVAFSLLFILNNP
jgi:1,4-dihydroxy-2-naphthoate octaprenyltransferase